MRLKLMNAAFLKNIEVVCFFWQEEILFHQLVIKLLPAQLFASLWGWLLLVSCVENRNFFLLLFLGANR